MRLCKFCKHYKIKDHIAHCDKDYWSDIEEPKSKILNSLLFECIDFDQIDHKKGFGDDQVFDLFSVILR